MEYGRTYTVPEDDAVIWRYMDFTKFVSLISTKSLFFSRADKFDDPFEGSFPKNERQNFIDILDEFDRYASYILNESNTSNEFEIKIANLMRETVSVFKVSGLEYSPLPLVEINRIIKLLESGFAGDHTNFLDMYSKWIKDTETLTTFSKILRKYTVINCWHLNEAESDAMWKLYTSLDQGVAIKSSYKRLRNCFSDETVHIGLVNYIDYETEKFKDANNTLLSPFLHKRSSFAHEMEIRAIIQCPFFEKNSNEVLPPPDSGINVAIDLHTLIESVHVSPNAVTTALYCPKTDCIECPRIDG